ncbi:MAG: DNA polymerase sliding clamp [Candidatus Thermoplasmatota archaeon]|nr:DNA polymerase sliding clamp [Candidatus Thermoplasmatota archaeon]
MLNITAKQDTMRTIVDILTVLVDEAKFNFKDGHIEIRCVDPSHVAMIRMEVDAAAFEAWESEEASIGFELNKLRDLISLAGAEDLIEMQYDENDGRVNIQVGEINRVIRPLDRAAMLEPRVPEVDLSSRAVLSGVKFSRALRAAKQVGDLVTLSLNTQAFTVNVSGDTDSVNVSYDAGEMEELVCDGPVRSQYSLQYLQPLAKRIENIVDSVAINFGENYPLKLEFEFAGGAGRCLYFLAPRIEEA